MRYGKSGIGETLRNMVHLCCIEAATLHLLLFSLCFRKLSIFPSVATDATVTAPYHVDRQYQYHN